MLGEQLGLAVQQFGEIGFERFGDLRVQLPSGIAQQSTVRRVLHQGVFERVDRVGRCAALGYQLGGDEACKSCLQFVL